MLTEIAVTSSITGDNGGQIHIWDLRSGAVLGTLKGNRCDPRTVAVIPSPFAPLLSSALIAGQNDKAMLGLWTWAKTQQKAKFVVPEKMSSVSVSHSGAFCVAGGLSGRIYVWEFSTGNLLRMFDAHYKAVKGICFTSDDAAFVTAGEDSVLNVWILSRVLDQSSDTSPTPHATLSSHALPVTDVRIGSGLFNQARIFSSSLDRTVKIWEAASGDLLATILFPKAIKAVVVDPGETKMYAGAVDGTVFGVDLYRRDGEGVTGLRQGTVEDAEGMGGVFRGHSQSITSLDLSFDGTLLLSGSEDGTAIVWDTASRQSLRTFSQHKSPVSDVRILLRPPELMDAAGSSHLIPTFKPFKRFQKSSTTDAAAAASGDLEKEAVRVAGWSGVKYELDAFERDTQISGDTTPSIRTTLHEAIDSGIVSGGRGAGSGKAQSEIERLREEVARLSERNRVLREANDELYQAAVSHVMGEIREQGKEGGS
ncbi:Pre-rRNA-processing protein ipi3 [Borealophlyctis nickersoniae]|nr:Pre-rRNA-processing protein ipi3 [Borealophlyctis nickersoniae]